MSWLIKGVSLGGRSFDVADSGKLDFTIEDTVEITATNLGGATYKTTVVPWKVDGLKLVINNEDDFNALARIKSTITPSSIEILNERSGTFSGRCNITGELKLTGEDSTVEVVLTGTGPSLMES